MKIFTLIRHLKCQNKNIVIVVLFFKGCRCCYLLIALPFWLEWSFTCCSLKKYHSCFPLFISPFSFNSIVKKEKKRWNSKIFIPCFNILNERVFYSCCILILGEKLACILVFSPVWEHIETGSTFVPDGKKNLAHVNDLLIKLSNFNCDATLPSMLYGSKVFIETECYES